MSLKPGLYKISEIFDAPVGLPQQPVTGNSSILPVVRESNNSSTTWRLEQPNPGRYAFFASTVASGLTMLPIGVSNNKVYALLNVPATGESGELVAQSEWVLEEVPRGGYLIKLANNLNRVWDASNFDGAGQVIIGDNQQGRFLNQIFRIEPLGT